MTEIKNEPVLGVSPDNDAQKQIETWYKLNDHFQWLIIFADQKASFMISLSLWLLAWNIAIISYNLNTLQDAIKSFEFSDGVQLALYIIFILAIIVLQRLVFHHSVNVVVPSTRNESKKSSIFYHWEVAKLNHEDFRSKMLWKNEVDILNDVIYQAYDKAFIAEKKFSLVWTSTTLLKVLVGLTILHPFIYLIINLLNG